MAFHLVKFATVIVAVILWPKKYLILSNPHALREALAHERLVENFPYLWQGSGISDILFGLEPLKESMVLQETSVLLVFF